MYSYSYKKQGSALNSILCSTWTTTYNRFYYLLEFLKFINNCKSLGEIFKIVDKAVEEMCMLFNLLTAKHT